MLDVVGDADKIGTSMLHNLIKIDEGKEEYAVIW